MINFFFMYMQYSAEDIKCVSFRADDVGSNLCGCSGH